MTTRCGRFCIFCIGHSWRFSGRDVFSRQLLGRRCRGIPPGGMPANVRLLTDGTVLMSGARTNDLEPVVGVQARFDWVPTSTEPSKK